MQLEHSSPLVPPGTVSGEQYSKGAVLSHILSSSSFFHPPEPLLFVPYSSSQHCIPAIFVRRRDRFVADVMLVDEEEYQGGTGVNDVAPVKGLRAATAHCINPGRMEGFVRQGAKCWLSVSTNSANRKHNFTLELIEAAASDGTKTICSCNTQRPNELVKAFLETRTFPGMQDWTELAREKSVPIEAMNGEDASKSSGVVEETEGNGKKRKRKSTKAKAGPRCRIDFWLRDKNGRQHWVEVKNCHHVVQGVGYFPDSVSERASRHLRSLDLLATIFGHRVTVVFMVQRDDVTVGVRPSDFHDPTFARTCRQVARRGTVSFRAFKVACDLRGSSILGEVPVLLDEYDPKEVGVVAAWHAHQPFTGWIRTFGNTKKKGSEGCMKTAELEAVPTSSLPGNEITIGEPFSPLNPTKAASSYSKIGTPPNTVDKDGAVLFLEEEKSSKGKHSGAYSFHSSWKHVANGQFPHNIREEREAKKRGDMGVRRNERKSRHFDATSKPRCSSLGLGFEP